MIGIPPRPFLPNQVRFFLSRFCFRLSNNLYSGGWLRRQVSLSSSYRFLTCMLMALVSRSRQRRGCSRVLDGIISENLHIYIVRHWHYHGQMLHDTRVVGQDVRGWDRVLLTSGSQQDSWHVITLLSTEIVVCFSLMVMVNSLDTSTFYSPCSILACNIVILAMAEEARSRCTCIKHHPLAT